MRVPKSVGRSRRVPAKVPRPIPKRLATIIEEIVSSRVAGIRSWISWITGLLETMDVPMFPVKTPRRYVKYWT